MITRMAFRFRKPAAKRRRSDRVGPAAISPSIWRSKVGRRIFLLFLFSAVIPIAVLAFFSIREVNRQLREQINLELHEETRRLNMILLDRLRSLDFQLSVLMPESLPKSKGTPEPRIQPSRLATPGFKAITLDQASSGKRLSLAGELISPPAWNNDNAAAWAEGKATLSVEPASASIRNRRIILARAIGTNSAQRELLLAEIDPGTAFDLAEDSDVLVCLADAESTPIDCSNPEAGAMTGFLPSDHAAVNSGWFDWRWQGQLHRASFRQVFLRPDFGVAPWTLLVSKPMAEVMLRADGFRGLFPPVLALSVGLVTLLSLIQIRRFLVPMEKLRQAAGSIAAQPLIENRVDIANRDEFGELGQAFNTMAGRLNRQFKTITAMAEIDRSILSAADNRDIIDVLLARLPEIIACDSLAVATVQTGTMACVTLYQAGVIGDVTAELSPDDVQQLQAHQPCSIIPESPGRIWLSPLEKSGNRYFQVFPINLQDRLAGLIVLGFRNPPSLKTDDLAQAEKVANRAAVALSNVSWREKLYRQAHYDALTGLPNRILLRDRLGQAFSRADRERSSVALLFIDLDRFKVVNDSLGHRTGDELLIQAAAVLQTCVRQTDTIARFGGDEFIVVLPGADSNETVVDAATRVAAELFAKLAQPFRLGEHEVFVGASIGVAIYPKDAGNMDDLIKQSDSAMYHAKAQGRNNVQFYSKPLTEKVRDRLSLETGLRRALERQELRLFFQPKVGCIQRELVGAEVLVRWEKPGQGMVPPAVFIPLAEETGLIVPIGTWILQQACRQAMQWQQEGRPRLRLAVNLSTRQFRDEGLVGMVADALSGSGLAADCLELEITEGAMMDDPAGANQTLRRIKELGVHISIDDFGTGYSSLAYLRQFPVDALKVDQSFVRGLPENRDSVILVASIVALAHNLNLNVVAEGVETEEQLALLKSLKCEQIQGYLISRPIPADRFADQFLPISDH